MVKYSAHSARALAFLKQFYNDIEIYIEDTTCHNMALFIFRNSIGSSVKLTSLNQLGGRSEVVRACRLDQANDGRRRLYVIDADYDLLTGLEKTRLKYLYRLRAYCFENLIISSEAVVALASEVLPNIPPDNLGNLLAHTSWERSTEATLLPLFIVYGVAQKLCPSVTTTGFSVHRLCISTPSGPVLSDKKVRARIRSVLRQMRGNVTLDQIRATRPEIEKRAKRITPKHFLVSGKDYMIPLLWSHLAAKVKYRGSKDELKARLARHYNPTAEPLLARRLRQCCNYTRM